jgi:hypothetical protein
LSDEEEEGAPPGPFTYVGMLRNLAANIMVIMQKTGDQTIPGHRILEEVEVREAFRQARAYLGEYGVGALAPVQVLELIEFHGKQEDKQLWHLRANLVAFFVAQHHVGLPGTHLYSDLAKIIPWWRLNGWGELGEIEFDLVQLVINWIMEEGMAAAQAAPPAAQG